MPQHTLKNTHIDSLLKKMRNRLIIIALILFPMFLSSCIKEKLETTYNKQESQIGTYIENALKKDESYTTVNNAGSNRLTYVHGEGEALEADGNVTFLYAGYIFNGSVTKSGMFTTNREESAIDAAWELTEVEYEPLTVNLKNSDLLPGLKNGLVGVKGGEECEIIFSGKYGFGHKGFGIVPANSALLYKIWVISVSND